MTVHIRRGNNARMHNLEFLKGRRGRRGAIMFKESQETLLFPVLTYHPAGIEGLNLLHISQIVFFFRVIYSSCSLSCSKLVLLND